MVILTDEGVAVMRGERPARLLLPPRQGVDVSKKKAGRSGGARRQAPDPESLDARERALFDALRSHRLDIARAEGVPPYVVASDRTLREIALLRPADLEALRLVHGIGPNKAERYGAGWLAVIGEQA
jgi:ATP-dependent DNA helicase RecQ